MSAVYCASKPAIEAAAEAYPDNDAGKLADALIAAHHPDLGLDRSVCLRDVVEALRKVPPYNVPLDQPMQERRRCADFIEHEFAQGAPIGKERQP